MRSKPSLQSRTFKTVESVKAEGGRGQLLVAASKEACHRYLIPCHGQSVSPLSSPKRVNIHPLTFPPSESSHTYTCIHPLLHHTVTCTERRHRHTEKNDRNAEQCGEKATTGVERQCQHTKGGNSQVVSLYNWDIMENLVAYCTLVYNCMYSRVKKKKHPPSNSMFLYIRA